MVSHASSSSLPIGCEVRARNGIIGRLDYVIVDEHTGEVSDLVVRLRGGDVSVVLPQSVVVKWDEDGITTDLLMEDLRHQRVYRPSDFQPCEPALAGDAKDRALAWRDRYGTETESRPAVAGRTPARVAESRPAIGRDTKVFVQDEFVGSLDHVLVDRATGEVTHLVLESEKAGQQSIVVPVERVESVEADEAHLSLTDEDWDKLPHYSARSDSALVAEVRDRLSEIGISTDELEVTADRGVVTLRGPVYDLETKRAADRAARAVEGVVDVEDYLTVDTALVAAVISALARDPRTSMDTFEVIANRGTITLKGVVPSEEVSRAAEEIARGVEGVQMVINELERNPKVREQPEGVFVIYPQMWRLRGEGGVGPL